MCVLVQMEIEYKSDVEIEGIQIQLLHSADNKTVIVPTQVNGKGQGKEWDFIFNDDEGKTGGGGGVSVDVLV